MPLGNPLWEVVEPYLVAANLYTNPDPTHGRYLLPHHPPHLELINNPDVKHVWRRVFLKPYKEFNTLEEAYDSCEIIGSEEVQLKPEELASGVKRGGRWVFYSVWKLDKEPQGGWEEGGKGLNRDLLLVHATTDCGTLPMSSTSSKLASALSSQTFLLQYGRSTGINSYLPSLNLLPAAVHAVLSDVAHWDISSGRHQRQVFLSGAVCDKPGRIFRADSSLYYVLKYPPSSSESAIADTHEGAPRPNIAGAFVLCPMVDVSPESRPSALIEYIAKGIKYFAGSLPLAKAVRGNVSDDPRVEADFFSDPIRLVHGSADRATSPAATERLFHRLPNADKSFKLYDGYEHVMCKVGIDAADDEKRQRVLKDWRSWLIAHCDGDDNSNKQE
ncbi:lysophospholipase [Trichosporon asahii var. asahii CBS 8904]|uniref:Lysophospholipase n=1 Tax=Trichosporon asahii var. asahii (strain CBS 8904) TaxID=1220162 RepID=K1VY03_TRIAC|nr:lysophospholipase [Trichosporon asahii var. asahii CBS 8904]